jgi:carboxymethylenebutenolidase
MVSKTALKEKSMASKLTALFILLIGNLAARSIETVHFESTDHQTTLVGYLFEPEGGGRHPAIVMLHGRAGAYSSLANGVYTSATLSKRHKQWGEFWAERGYLALLVDSFGPRGYAGGFPVGSYKDRPAAVSEQTVRPLDAYGALSYLRGRRDVVADRIGLQGWSNGAMTTLVTMGEHALEMEQATPETGFRAALAEYPGCGMDAVKEDYKPYAHLLLTVGTADEEVSATVCETFAKRAKQRGADLEVVVFEGAEHNYDDPSKKKRSNPADEKATAETMRRAEQLFGKYLQ